MIEREGILVFISNRSSTCGECGEQLGNKAWVTLNKGNEPCCLSCADLDHLVFLPSGQTALTRRAKKYSALSAVVLQWSRARKRNERQGLLVEESALARAEEECLADSELRAQRRARQSLQREEADRHYLEQFANRVRELFPGCPTDRERAIAEHACLKYSGRVGRSASARMLEAKAVRLSVMAHLRHTETKYDHLLAQGLDRWEARAEVEPAVQLLLHQWEFPG